MGLWWLHLEIETGHCGVWLGKDRAERELLALNQLPETHLRQGITKLKICNFKFLVSSCLVQQNKF